MIEDFEDLLHKFRFNHEKINKFQTYIKKAILIISFINTLLLINMKLRINQFSSDENFKKSNNYAPKNCYEIRDEEFLNIMTGFSFILNCYLIYQSLTTKSPNPLQDFSLIDKSELYSNVSVLLFFVFSQFLYILNVYINKTNSLFNCGEAYNSNIYISIVNLITIIEFCIKHFLLISIWKMPEKENQTQIHLGSEQIQILPFHLKSFIIILTYQFVSIFVFCSSQKYFFTSFMNNLSLLITSYLYTLYYNYKQQIQELKQKNLTIQSQMDSNKIETKAKSLYLAKAAHEYKNILLSIVNICNNQIASRFNNFNFESSSDEEEDERRYNIRIIKKRENDASSKLVSNMNSDHAGFILALCNYMLILIEDLNVFTKMENSPKTDDSQSHIAINTHKEDLAIRSIIPEVDLISALNFCLNIFIIRQKNDPNKRGIKLLTNYEIESFKKVSLPETRLKQVVINLLSNAYKFTISGEVILSAKKYEDEQGRKFLRISVSDTGLGISQNERVNLFNPFKTVERNQEFNCHGSGLGLSIVNDLLTSLNSKLEFTSEKNIGSIFWFDIHDANIIPQRQSSGHLSFYSKLNSSNSNAETLITDQNLIITESQKNFFFSLANVYNRSNSNGTIITQHSNSNINCSLFDVHSSSTSRKDSINRDDKDKSSFCYSQIIPENVEDEFTPQQLLNIETEIDKNNHFVEYKPFENHIDIPNIHVLPSPSASHQSKKNSISSFNMNFNQESEKLPCPAIGRPSREDLNRINKIVTRVSTKKINLFSKSKFNNKEKENKTALNHNIKNVNFPTSEIITSSRSESPKNYRSKKHSQESLISINKVIDDHERSIHIENIHNNFSQNIQLNFNIDNHPHEEFSSISLNHQKNNININNYTNFRNEVHIHEAGGSRFKDTQFCNILSKSKLSSSGSQHTYSMSHSSHVNSRKSHKDLLNINTNISPLFKLRILLCDDDEQICRPTSKFIKKICKEKQIDVNVLTCNNGIECIYLIYQEFLKRNYFDILFIDETMPFIKGSLVTKVLKTMISDKQINNILIYAVTAYEDKDILKAISVNGCDGILHKPLNKSSIEKIIQLNFLR
jgi:signal transduction histidine kinase